MERNNEKANVLSSEYLNNESNKLSISDLSR